MEIVDRQPSISNSESIFFKDYINRIQQTLHRLDLAEIAKLKKALAECKRHDRRVFVCGNGGSAANAAHIANDLLYGSAANGIGLKVEALSANPSIMSCLANDIGYDQIFSHQLAVQGEKEDLLIVLSGSGNSPNIINALQYAKKNGMLTCAIVGYCGGEARGLADITILSPVDDMQISEDVQLIVAHMVTQALLKQSHGFHHA